MLVTGGCGFIGRHLIREFALSGQKVLVVDNMRSVDRTFLSSFLEDLERKGRRNICIVEEDIRNEKQIAKIIRSEGITTCVHLAALVGVRQCDKRPYEALDINVNGTLSILRASTENGVKRFVFASSSAVYGEVERVPISENRTLRPISLYGATKVAGEALASAYSELMDMTICLRFFNVYGNNESIRHETVIEEFRMRLSKGLPPIIFGTGNQIRDFIHVDDVVRSIMLAKELTGTAAQGRFTAINVGSGKPVSITNLAKKMQRSATRHTGPLIFRKPIPGDITQSYANTRKSHVVLGFKPSVQLNEAILRDALMTLRHKTHPFSGTKPGV